MPRAFMMMSSSGGSVPSIQAATSPTGRPRATANFSSSDSKPLSRRRRKSSRPPAASVPRSSTGLSFVCSSSFFASAIVGRPLLLVSLGRVVPDVLNLLDERLLLHDVLVEVDDRGLAAEVDVGAVDAGRVFERVLDERGARVAAHALYV